jgi:hypothetical protein
MRLEITGKVLEKVGRLAWNSPFWAGNLVGLPFSSNLSIYLALYLSKKSATFGD